MAETVKQSSSSEYLLKRGQNQRIFPESKSTFPEQNLTMPSATSEDLIANVMNSLQTPTTKVIAQLPANQLKPPPRIALPFGGVVQTKLTIGEANDSYEQEADRVAKDVVQRIHSSGSATDAQGQGFPYNKPSFSIQRHSTLQNPVEKPISGAPPPAFEKRINRAKTGGSNLTPGLQQKMGNAMGADFRTVKIHTGREADSLNRSIQARAFTTGRDIFFRQGAYNPSTKGGQELIAHELTHVVQQNSSVVQRHPSHADEEEVQRKVIQRHPSHADEEEVQRQTIVQRHPGHSHHDEEIIQRDEDSTAAPVEIKESMTGSQSINRISRDTKTKFSDLSDEEKRKYRQLTQDFGTTIGPVPNADTTQEKESYTIEGRMLERLENVLRQQLPTAHVKGNDAIETIHSVDPDPNSPIGGASSFNLAKKTLNLVVPNNPLTSSRLSPDRYANTIRGGVLDGWATNRGAMSQWNFDQNEDESFGLDSRAIFDDVFRTGGNFYEWVIRHEIGHAVDSKIKFTSRRSRLPEFGGWKQYGDGKAYDMEELAKAFLTYGGFSATEYNREMAYTVSGSTLYIEQSEYDQLSHAEQRQGRYKKATKYSHGFPRTVYEYDGPDETRSAKLLDVVTPFINTIREAHNTQYIYSHLRRRIKDDLLQGLDNTQKQAWLDTREGKIERVAEALRMALNRPYLLSDGGPIVINDRIYQKDHYGTWVSYLKKARQHIVSNYQFSSPGEWFAEAYAAYYEPSAENGSKTRLSDKTKQWFLQNLGSSPGDDVAQQGNLVDHHGNLQQLSVLEDKILYGGGYLRILDKLGGMDAWMTEILSMDDGTLVKTILEALDAIEWDGDVENSSLDEEKLRTTARLQPGDIMILHGNKIVNAGQGAASVARGIVKLPSIIVPHSRYNYFAKEVARLGNVKFGHAMVYLKGDQVVHAVNDGVVTGLIPPGKYTIYRSNNQALGQRAAEIANNWRRAGYSSGKAFGSALWSSSFSQERALLLGLYARSGISPKKMICSELAISCYQAAAVEPEILKLPQNLQDELANLLALNDETEKKQGLRQFAKQNSGRINFDVPQETLRLNPTATTPQRLAVKLKALAQMDNPVWDYMGVFYHL